MLNNFLFYNAEQTTLLLEETTGHAQLLETSTAAVKVKIPKLSNGWMVPHIENQHMYLTGRTRAYKSKAPLSLFYLVKTKEDPKDFVYNIVNLENKVQYSLTVRKNLDLVFKALFSSYFIFTDFEESYQIVKRLPDGFLVENYEAEFWAIDDKRPPRHLVKCYDKKEANFGGLTKVLMESLERLREPKCGSCFMEIFLMFETDQKFILTFEKPSGMTVKDFAASNHNDFSYKEAIDILLKLVDICENMEKNDLQLCVMPPETTMLRFESADPNHSAIANNQPATLKEKLKGFKGKTASGNINEELRQIAKSEQLSFGETSPELKASYLLHSAYNRENGTAKYLKSAIPKGQGLLNQPAPQGTSNRRPNNIKLPPDSNERLKDLRFCLTNVEFIFKADKYNAANGVYVKVGFADICFLSNSFVSLSKNLNVLNIGLLYYYLISSIDLSPSYDIIAAKGEETVFFNFSSKILEGLDKMHKQILYYVFTCENLQSLRTSLEHLRVLEDRLSQIEREKQESFDIVTSVTELSNSVTGLRDKNTSSLKYSDLVDVNDILDDADDKEEFFGPKAFAELDSVAPRFNDMQTSGIDDKRTGLLSSDDGSCTLLRGASIKDSLIMFLPKKDDSR